MALVQRRGDPAAERGRLGCVGPRSSHPGVVFRDAPPRLLLLAPKCSVAQWIKLSLADSVRTPDRIESRSEDTKRVGPGKHHLIPPR